jgi:hypothetical protein
MPGRYVIVPGQPHGMFVLDTESGQYWRQDGYEPSQMNGTTSRGLMLVPLDARVICFLVSVTALG